MTAFLRSGSTYKPVSEADLDMHPLLPPGNFIITKDANTGELLLSQVDPFTVPIKLYGDIVPKATRILNTYFDRPSSTGVLLNGEKGSGKALRVDQLVYTPSGPKQIGAVREGDLVYADDGKLTTVDGVFPQGTRDLFEVVFNDGSTVVADGEHLWSVTQMTINRHGYSRDTTKMVNGKRTKSPRPLATKTTLEIKAALEVGTKFGVPLAAPVEFPQSDLNIDRYTVGLLIGDGSLNSPTIGISSKDSEIIDYLSASYNLKHVTGCDYRFVDVKVLSDQLVHLGLRYTVSNTKFIPDQLKYDSVENRFALLQGLMDTDGTVSKRGSITYTTVSPQLAADVVWLARSLGFRSSIQYARRPSYSHNGEKRVGQLAYTVQLTGANNIKVFRLARKQERVKRCSSLSKTIVSVVQTGSDKAVCIHVTHPSHRFLTNDFTVTHNTQLARLIGAVGAEKHNMPCIIINAPWVGDQFFKLIQSIHQPCMVLFDEFEKVYDSDDQKSVLTLLDGVFPSKKLFVLTCNDKWLINDHMRNRPGRIYYLLDYKGIPEDFIVEYCADNLASQEHVPAIVRVSKMFNEFNFDMLKAMVEEMNRYGETPQQVITLLNARPGADSDGTYKITMSIGGEKVTAAFYPTEWEGSPLGEDEIAIRVNFDEPGESDEFEVDNLVEDVCSSVPAPSRRGKNKRNRSVYVVRQTNLRKFNAELGQFEYELPDGVIVKFARQRLHEAKYDLLF